MTTATHNIHEIPAYYVVATNRKQDSFYAGWDDWAERPLVVARHQLAQATHYATLEQAQADVTYLNMYGTYGKVLKVPAKTTATLTDAGRATVAARRAARNAERKL